MERDGVTRVYYHRLGIEPPEASQAYPKRVRHADGSKQSLALGKQVRKNVDLYFGYSHVSQPRFKIIWNLYKVGRNVPRGKFVEGMTFYVPSGIGEYEYLVQVIEKYTDQRGFTVIVT